MIETERLRLRNWTRDDVAPFVRYTNTPGVMRWLGGVLEPAALEARIVDRFIPWQETLGHTFWVVERKSDDALLGFCGLKIADDAGSPVAGELEIGWRLREDAWGQGYAKEAATASLDFAFEALGAERVVALTVQGNSPSWGLMERLGMVRHPELDYRGPAWAEGIVIVYRIARDEWRS
ncbi:GNAT family N-acetyltransferase [Sphingosinicella sp. BN140058]|uniref:GNAT family N-acetyltransferase n=1 Tax=Sphingosinicella sp. BN140058 TaxID=1892855 RepID=UPI0010103935|nr:GNAT family N-acetyltransferase [Sphingosinicella sp. BN140058]QAY75452.1 N-acetyltransferase [Sphingosinicella sp. BN140058]